MLNFDVKRKINTLRDILVGKVPDPKAQVEQITIALIYKFMDDMDLAGAEFGGKRVFFAGDYEKYAFAQIMLPEHSSQDRLNLYAEGIEKMVNNAELPQLFRDILRGAYIPYRDPETLNRFLKEIAEFNYDHSEDLGDSFEYLLSIMGSQGDAGQFRTPRHIIDMMVEIIAPRKNETVLDPACGTAGFLISAYKYIDKQNRNEEGKSTLSGEDRKRMADNFAGYDISPDMVRLSRVNMYLHGFSNPQISEYDTLTSLDKWDDTYDVILANPPFMTPKGGISPHNRYRVSAKRAEVLFVDYIAEHLNPTGRAAIVVPEGIVFQAQTAYRNLRRYLVDENLLYAVISLPAGVFNPYSGVKTSILLIDRTLASKSDNILFVKLNNDGYDLGAQRRAIEGTEIPEIISILKDYKKGIDVVSRKNVIIAPKYDIAKQEYILLGERYKSITSVHTFWPLVKLGDICELNPKKSELKVPQDLEVSFVPMADVNEHQMAFTPTTTRAISTVYTGYTYFANNDVLLAKVTPCFENGKSGIAKNLVNGIGFGSSEFFVLRADTERIIPEYIYLMISTDEFLKAGKQAMTGAVGLQRISKEFVHGYKIPLPPLSVQQDIVKEIVEYQAVIDGARQVVDNYKPIMKIDHSCDMTTLGNVCDFVRGPFGGSLKKEIFVDQGYLVYEQRHAITNDFTYQKYFIDEKKFQEMRRFEVFTGDILVSCSGTMGKIAIVPENHLKGIINQALLKLTPQKGKTIPLFVKLYLESSSIQKHYFANQAGAAIQNVVSVKQLKEMPFPNISLEEQMRIVEKLQIEMNIIEQNKHLIEIFERKIKDRISEVWGE